jgi:hypothetical protein
MYSMNVENLMILYRKQTLALALGFAVLISACGNLQVGIASTDVSPTQPQVEAPSPTAVASPDESQVAPTQAENPPAPSSQRYTFDQLGISLEVPAELFVWKDPLVDLNDPSRLESYLFYIQNYGYPEGPNSGNFQMYGHLQFVLPTVSWEQFAEVQNDTNSYEYVNYIEINGIRGFDAQFSGQRNRYVYMFYLDGRVLSIAVSEPTPENKALSDQIISTLELTGTGLDDASHVQKIGDPQGYYQLYIPDDWVYTFDDPRGIQLSSMEASSPDAEVVIEDQNGPHSNVYYKSGISMSFVVLNDDSALSEPSMVTILHKGDMYLSGVEINDYTFVEPSTMEGEIREFRFYHNGHSYLMRFTFPSETDQEVIELIMRRLILTDQ